MAVAVIERFKQELMYGLSAGTKKCGCCREVDVSGGSTVLSTILNYHAPFDQGLNPKISETKKKQKTKTNLNTRKAITFVCWEIIILVIAGHGLESHKS